MMFCYDGLDEHLVIGDGCRDFIYELSHSYTKKKWSDMIPYMWSQDLIKCMGQGSIIMLLIKTHESDGDDTCQKFIALVLSAVAESQTENICPA
jgi:hypothetical protein